MKNLVRANKNNEQEKEKYTNTTHFYLWIHACYEIFRSCIEFISCSPIPKFSFWKYTNYDGMKSYIVPEAISDHKYMKRELEAGGGYTDGWAMYETAYSVIDENLTNSLLTCLCIFPLVRRSSYFGVLIVNKQRENI